MTASEARDMFWKISSGRYQHFSARHDQERSCGDCIDLTDSLMGAWQQGRMTAARECAEMLRLQIDLSEITDCPQHELAVLNIARTEIMRRFGLTEGAK